MPSPSFHLRSIPLNSKERTALRKLNHFPSPFLVALIIIVAMIATILHGPQKIREGPAGHVNALVTRCCIREEKVDPFVNTSDHHFRPSIRKASKLEVNPSGLSLNNPGDFLLSHAVSRAVPSAPAGLT